MSRPTELQMPVSLTSGATIVTEVTNSVVIIGANGSGKTRLGVWFEFQSAQQQFVRRVGAQKSLNFPDSVSPSSLKDATDALEIGVDMSSFISNRTAYLANVQANKRNNKWSQKPETALVDDYQKLLVYLISEQYQESLSYTQNARNQTIYSAPPDTKIDRIKQIWEQILPHRELVLEASRVGVKPVDGLPSSVYEASAMNDGERVAFYLIGQCLAASAGSIIVIDEPEIHLHRVIQARLWDAIERERPDCLLVYLTHDLEFAASRTEAKKVWIKGFNGQAWDWQLIPSESEGLPEEVLLAVLGSRKPVLFTEGDRGGSEQAIFSRLYPGWTIMPRGGCDQVIQATQAFRALRHLHGIDCQGIVDLDYRTPQEVASLKIVGVHVLETQEIENLLLIEPVLKLVADHVHTQGLIADTAADIVNKVKAFAWDTLAKDKGLLASRKTAWELEQQLHKIDRRAIGITALEEVREKTARFDVAAT